MLDSAAVLVAIMNSQRDWQIAQRDRWYRIPLKSAPRRLPETRCLAFYQTRVFGPERWAVKYDAPIVGHEVVERRELLPDEPDHPRADRPYYRLRLGELQALPRPIGSRRWRRIVFIPTTWRKLRLAEEINDLFHESPLEDVVWAAFKRERIEAERQLFVAEARAIYCLDFAIFCRAGQIDVECDGDTWHARKETIPLDNARNNFLTSRGWSVLRFGSRDIAEQRPACLSTVRDTLYQLGGPSTAKGLPRLSRRAERARRLAFW